MGMNDRPPMSREEIDGWVDRKGRMAETAKYWEDEAKRLKSDAGMIAWFKERFRLDLSIEDGCFSISDLDRTSPNNLRLSIDKLKRCWVADTERNTRVLREQREDIDRLLNERPDALWRSSIQDRLTTVEHDQFARAKKTCGTCVMGDPSGHDADSEPDRDSDVWCMIHHTWKPFGPSHRCWLGGSDA